MRVDVKRQNKQVTSTKSVQKNSSCPFVPQSTNLPQNSTVTLIITSKGIDHLCLFDSCDRELIETYRWHLNSHGYAVTQINGKHILMHRLILGVVDRPDIEVDHIYHNKLDNRRAMIRTCSRAENSRNRAKRRGYSQFKGVYRENYLWHSQICCDQKVINLGRYRSEVTAAKAYDRAARELFGAFCNPNFHVPDTLPQQLKMM
jgi:hypothetical protein